jgi:hypothetical protein
LGRGGIGRVFSTGRGLLYDICQAVRLRRIISY